MSELAILKYGLLFFAGAGTATISLSYVLKGRLTFLAKGFLVSILTLGLAFTYMYVVEPNWIQITRLHVEDPVLARVFADTRVVQISDIHLTEGIRFRERQTIKKVNALKPDFIFITGDFLDDLTQLNAAKEFVSRLQATQGIYGVTGNTDRIVMTPRTLANELAPEGIDILIDESRAVNLANGQRLWLIGLDDPYFRAPRISAAFRGTPEKGAQLMLAHDPRVFEHVAPYRPNLILAGDTHGGQIGIDLLIRLSDYANRTPYMRGFYEKNGLKMYVNRGIGMKTIPMRFLCRPEITVLEFKP